MVGIMHCMAFHNELKNTRDFILHNKVYLITFGTEKKNTYVSFMGYFLVSNGLQRDAKYTTISLKTQGKYQFLLKI